jgi:hypothetical protein
VAGVSDYEYYIGILFKFLFGSLGFSKPARLGWMVIVVCPAWWRVWVWFGETLCFLFFRY